MQRFLLEDMIPCRRAIDGQFEMDIAEFLAMFFFAITRD